MSNFLASRRKALADKGRPMILRRLLTTSTNTEVTVQGFVAAYKPEQIGQGSIMQGDCSVAILNDEIVAAGWPGPPRARDIFIIEARYWTVMGASQIYDGTLLIGHQLQVRGG